MSDQSPIEIFCSRWKIPLAITNEITFNTQEFLVKPNSASDQLYVVKDRRPVQTRKTKAFLKDETGQDKISQKLFELIY